LKETWKNLRENELFQLMMFGVLMYVAMNAMILLTIHIPPEAILDSGLDEILKVFED